MSTISCGCRWDGIHDVDSCCFVIAEGGRLERELRYSAAALGEQHGATHQLVIQTPKDPGASLMHPSALQAHLRVLKAATEVTVHLFDM